MDRSERRRLARETDAIVAGGGYLTDTWVELSALLRAARQQTHLHLPDDPLPAAAAAAGEGRHAGGATSVEVTGETSLAAALRLHSHGATGGLGSAGLACLNFASARHPGGGYRNGAQAQEESLARASALATCLEQIPEFYGFHRRQQDPIYSDRVICSPEVPVFRDDTGDLLPEPALVTYLTCAAPNAGDLLERGWRGDLQGVLHQRARRILAIAAHHRYDRLVLGAWGCGVFRNDPEQVAASFADLLGTEFAASFSQVTFAVYDPRPEAPTRRIFRDALQGR